MKRIKSQRRGRRIIQRTIRAISERRVRASVDERVTMAVLWAVGRLALKLGPA